MVVTRTYRLWIRFSLAGHSVIHSSNNRSQALDALLVLCDDRDRLLHEYNAAVLGVSQAVRALADLAGTASGSDYELLGREKDRAKARLRQAQSAYERHIAEHGCG